MVLKNQKGGAACHFRRPKTWGVLALIFPDVNTLIDDVFKARFQTVLALVTSEKENIQCNVFKNPKESQKWIKNAEIVPVALK